MLTLYRPRNNEDSDSIESEKEKIIPAGRPYLTKVNGKLVMAREKKPKTADIAIDLLGEAFGVRTIVRRRSKSLERPKSVPLLITENPYQPQLPILPYTAPIPQHSSFQSFTPYQHMQQGYAQSFIPYQQMQPHQTYFPNMILMPQYPQPEPQRYAVSPSKPTETDFASLKRIDAHYNEMNNINKKTKRLSVDLAPVSSEDVTTKATVTITKHVCANCGRLRSRKYHVENPIKAGDVQTLSFCRKCQKDSSEASDSDGVKSSKKKENKKAKREKGQKVGQASQNSESSNEDEQSNALDTKVRRKPKSKKDPEAQPPPPEYIIVEEHSEDERIPSRRGSLRIERSEVGGRICRQEQYEPRRQPPRNESCTDSQRTVGGQRRRVQRINPDTVPTAPWDTPHVIHPQTGDETIVVTERFVYRPEKYMEEQRRQRELIEKEAYAQNHSVEFEEEASRYYQDDWWKEELVHTKERPRQSPGRYRRDSIQDSELAGPESTDYYRAYNAVFHDVPPRAPSPPSPAPASPLTEAWPEISPYPLTEERMQRVKSPGKGKLQRMDSPDPVLGCRRRSNSTSNSNYRPSSVQEATDGGTKALIQSPQRFRAPSFDDDYSDTTEREYIRVGKTLLGSPKQPRREPVLSYDDEFDDMIERERIVERETKRVTFRDPSPISVSSAWSDSQGSKSFLRRKTSWDESNVGRSK